MDGMLNKAGLIHAIADVFVHYKDHSEQVQFAVTSLGKQEMILGHTWLWEL
jgi:hypothetical protein